MIGIILGSKNFKSLTGVHNRTCPLRSDTSRTRLLKHCYSQPEILAVLATVGLTQTPPVVTGALDGHQSESTYHRRRPVCIQSFYDILRVRDRRRCGVSDTSGCSVGSGGATRQRALAAIDDGGGGGSGGDGGSALGYNCEQCVVPCAKSTRIVACTGCGVIKKNRLDDCRW